MKNVLTLIFPLAFLFFTCQPKPENGTEETTTVAPAPVKAEPAVTPPGPLSPADSAKVGEIKQYTEYVVRSRAHKNEGFEMETRTPKGGHPKDKVNIVRHNGQPVRGIVSAYSENSEMRDYYFFKDGQTVQYTHREWFFNIDVPFVKEIIAYIDGGRIISLEERKMDLEQGQKPTVLLRMPLQTSPLDRDSFLNILKTKWQAIEKSVEKE